MRTSTIWLVATVTIAACGTLQSSAPDAGTTVCTPGATIACVGPAGCSGGQACKQDGTGYGLCDCGVADGGGGDADNDSGGGEAGNDAGGVLVQHAAASKAEWAGKALAPNENGVVLLQDPLRASVSLGFRAESTKPVTLRSYEPNTSAFDEPWVDMLSIGVL